MARGRAGTESRVAPERCAVGREIRDDGDLTVHEARSPDGERVLLVRAGSGERCRWLGLLADLLEHARGDGVRALPRVIGRSRTALVLEDAPALRSAPGRRAAEVGTPSTRERLARAEARQDLDALLAHLHDRGIALGLASGEGLGIRADGSVLLRDVLSLVHGADLRARIADQLWVDSVVADPGRTLRRRIDAVGRTTSGPAHGSRARSVEETPIAAWVQEFGRPAAGRVGAAVTRRRPVPAPLGRSGPVLVAIAVSAIALTLTSLLLAGPGAEEDRVAPSPATEAATTSALPPEDPAALVSSIALARHEHLVTGGADAATAPGSPAAEQDARLADAYDGYQVSGWTTTVVSAEVVGFDEAAGTVRIRARISDSACTLTAPDGARRIVPASPEREVLLDLVWVEGRWLLHEARSV